MSVRLVLAGLALVVSTLSACQSFTPLSNGPRNDDDEQHGLWRYWYDRDHQHLRAEGSWKRDRQDGRWRFWFPDGNPEWEAYYVDRRLSGLSTSWYSDGTTRSRGLFAAGDEQGAWTFWNRGGKIEQQGEFDRGRATGRWTYWSESGALLADGFRWNDERIGLWRFWSAEGAASEKEYPVPTGVEFVFEEYEGGNPRREGLLVDGKREGRWVVWNEDGSRRTSGSFHAGRADGFWTLYDRDGFPQTAGTVKDDRIVGPWQIWSDGRCMTLDCERFVQPAEVDPRSGDASSMAIEALVARRILEVSQPAQGTRDTRALTGAPAPSVLQLEATARLPRIPIKPNPWTKTEEEVSDYLVERYTKGPRAVVPPPGPRYARAQKSPPGGDPVRARQLLDKPLPQTVFADGNGGRFDLMSLSGRPVVFVILRGYDGQVCIYCRQQTKALAKLEAEFAKRGADVVLLYPGLESRLDVFMNACKENEQGAGPPYRLLADVELRLVKPLGLVAELAVPTTLVLDRRGIVRWAYVGTHDDDRPGCAEVLKALDELGGS